MKTIKCYICAVLLALPLFASAQDLVSVAKTANKATQVPEFIQVRNQLERYSIAQPQEWLPDYYLAYVDVQLSFRTPSKGAKKQYLDEAQNYLSKLVNISGKDLSEVYTLKGFRLYALIAYDPQTNGPIYSGEIITDYETALKLNPNNPRALILLALFKNDMAKFMHEQYESFQTDVDKAAVLLVAGDTTTVNPSWGMGWIERARTQK